MKIVDICTKVISGGTPLRSIPEYYENGTIPWLKTGEIKKEYIYKTSESITRKGLKNSSAKLIPKNSVILAMYGDGNTAGHVAINKIDLATNQACCNLIIDQHKANYRYIYFFLKGSYDHLINLKLGGSQQNLNATTIKNIDIPLIRGDIQKKIAAILSAYDDFIENNNRRIAIQEKMAEEIYKEWFVRMRFPGYKKAKFVKGIPADWRVNSLENIANLTMGQSPKSEFYNTLHEGLPFNQGVGTYGNRFPQKILFCSVKGRIAEKGDILFSVRAPVGRLNIADCKMIIGRGLAAIRHNNNYNSYLFYLLKSYFGTEDLIGNGAIFNSVGKDELYKFKILQPEKNIIELFEEKISIVDKKIKFLLQKNNNLKQTRDRLLTRLISGKLSVEDPDILFPKSMKEESDA